MRSRIVVLEQSNAKLVATCAELSVKVNELTARFDASEARLASSKATVQDLEAKNRKLEQKGQNQEVRSRALEDYSRQMNMVVAGAHECPTVEAALKALNNMATAIDIKLADSDIYVCHSLPSRSGPPRLLVKFTSRLVKEIFMARVKAKKLTTGMLGWPCPNRLLRLTDYLSPATSELLMKAKRRLHWNNRRDFKYVWSKHGRILAKVADKTKIFEIRSENDIDGTVLFGREVVNDLKARGVYEPPPPPPGTVSGQQPSQSNAGQSSGADAVQSNMVVEESSA